MKDVEAQLEHLRKQSSECELIRDLATDPKKKDLFAKLAEHFKVLAHAVENAKKDIAGPAIVPANEHAPSPKDK